MRTEKGPDRVRFRRSTTACFAISHIHCRADPLPELPSLPSNLAIRTAGSAHGCVMSSGLTRASNSAAVTKPSLTARSEEHTSELQSHSDLVCRLLLEKKKKKRERTKRTIDKVVKI